MTVTREVMHSALGVTGSYQVPEALMTAMLDNGKREALCACIADATDDMSHDGMTTYFQDEQGDRDALKQDFTPPAVCDLVAAMAGDADAYLDACAGTGGLTISLWALHPHALFRCEEYSARTVPALLLNMAVRNMRGEVVRKDVLTGETFERYALEPSDRFSVVHQVDELPDRRYAVCVQNPPYSMKWDGLARPWMRYGAPPKSKCDYAFVEYGMAHADKTIAILPHGVLFRGAAEGRIRKAMLLGNMLDAVVGLPEKMFLHTGIPVCVLSLSHGDGSVCVVNADELHDIEGKLNVMRPDHVRDVISCLSMRRDVDRLCHVADAAEIKRNGFNLNIPRYVDRYEEPEVPDVAELFQELNDIEGQIVDTKRSLLDQLRLLVGTTDESRQELAALMPQAIRYLEDEEGQLAWEI
jgi:type I restriction enzyme M protein